MRVLVGVCGGIAAYKAAEIVRALQERGAEVEVGMTAAAERFVTALTFNALTGRPVYTGLWSADQAREEGAIEHIRVAQAVDVLLIAPASAHMLARMAHGLADDFLSTVYLATPAPVVVAPAMNVVMWEHPATVANVRLLRERGVRVIEPEAGYLACGMTGGGRLAAVEAIAEAALVAGQPVRQDFAGETVMVTAGGTREPLDPVRFLGNRSSGRMGYALAEAARARGARVLLVTASALEAPAGCEVMRVETAEAMGRAMERWLPEASIVIGAAAVADYRATAVSAEKIRRQGRLLLELEPTPDLLAGVIARRRPGTLVVAFAAETEALERNARAKMLRKGADAIVANDVSVSGRGFDAEENAGLFLAADRRVELPLQSKRAMADAVLDEVRGLRMVATAAAGAAGTAG